jgi:hypothetical protein
MGHMGGSATPDRPVGQVFFTLSLVGIRGHLLIN